VVISYRSIKSIKFPVFVVPSANWLQADGLVFVDEQLIDDKNMPGETLGIRRMQTPHRELLKLRKALVDLNGILKQRTNTFIDS